MRNLIKQKTRNLKPRQVQKVLVFDEHGPVEFTCDEIATLYLLSRGLTDKDIARELGKSERTIEGRISRLKAKLHCKTRIDLAITSYKYQLGCR